MAEIKVKCESCGAVTSVDTDDFDYHEESEERSMGRSLERWGKLEFECSNRSCSKDITVEINTTEYPEGNIEDGDTTVTGGELV